LPRVSSATTGIMLCYSPNQVVRVPNIKLLGLETSKYIDVIHYLSLSNIQTFVPFSRTELSAVLRTPYGKNSDLP